MLFNLALLSALYVATAATLPLAQDDNLFFATDENTPITPQENYVAEDSLPPEEINYNLLPPSEAEFGLLDSGKQPDCRPIGRWMKSALV